MFKKKPQIKNLTSLRSSDRRKLADQIIKDFQVDVAADTELSSDHPQDEACTAALTSIRTSLVPENCRSAKFSTHSGPDASLVTGIIYVGTYPDREARVLWFRLGDQLYPTVYVLWRNPRLLPLLHTGAMVTEKLRAGADLMVPGLARGPPFSGRAKKGAIVAVASLDNPSVPIFVGICEIDVSALDEVAGAKGHAVRGLHWEGDELWAWANNSTGGESAPEIIPGWDQLSKESSDPIVEGVSAMALNEDLEDGGIPLDVRHDEEAARGDEPPSTAEIDEAFEKAFTYALYTARKDGSAPHYGIEFPIIPSFLVASLIQPYLPVCPPSQAQNFTMKKTSWKNAKKFIKHLEKKNLVKSKDRNGGETVIVDIDFNDQDILNFTPYRLLKAEATSEDAVQSDPALQRLFKIQILIRASHKLVPTLLASKTVFYSPQQVTDSIRKYIDANLSLTVGTSSPRFIKLDPFLASLLSSTHAPDVRQLSTGEIARDILLRRIVDDSHLCQRFWILLHGGQRYRSENPDPFLPKPRAGDPPKVSITIEKRTGSKTVTKVARLEAFNIVPEILAADLRKECASSTSVGQLMGGKPGLKEVLVQGDHRVAVEKELTSRGLKSDWIEVVDKGGKGKFKKPR